MSTASLPRQLRQGGNLTELTGITQDLSLCANPYGPAPAAVAALDSFDTSQLVRPPYGAAEKYLAAYAASLGVPAGELTPGRGVSEFITLTSQILLGKKPERGRRAVAVIVPDYSGTITAFHYADLIGPPPAATPSVRGRLDLVHRAMTTHQVVILSNPSNPEGLYLPLAALLDIATGNPSSQLIVDESYLAFQHGAKSLAGTDLDNVVVWQSTGKTLGLVGLRAGIMWTRHRPLREEIRRYVPAWPLSSPTTAASVAALADTAWRDDTLRRIHADGYLVEALLVRLFGASQVSGSAHFRFVRLDQPGPIAAHLETKGIAVRTFDGSIPGHTSGIRVLAPTSAEQRDRLSDAVNSCPAELLPR